MSARAVALSILTAVTLCVVVDDVSGQSLCPPQKLAPSDGRVEDVFGRAVATDGAVAVVGADWVSGEAGAAHLFRFDGAAWQHEAEIRGEGLFGRAVAIQGDLVAIGAPWWEDTYNNVTGAVFLYRYNGDDWVWEQRLVSDDAAQGDGFGGSLALDGDRLIIGARGDDDLGHSSGSAYVFRNTGSSWTQESKLLAPDGGAGDDFGGAVALNADRVVVGAQLRDNGSGNGSGTIYVFRRDGDNWIDEATLAPSTSSFSEFFGYAVGIEGSTIAAGAYLKWTGASRPGAVLMYQLGPDGWEEDAQLVADNGADNDFFGWSLDMSGPNRVIVGARRVDYEGQDTGAAYVFDRVGNDWIQSAPLHASVSFVGNGFGGSVAIAGDTALVGGWYFEDDHRPVHVFTHDGDDWIEQPKLAAPGGADGDRFGQSVSFGTMTAAIGASGDNTRGDNAGAAHLYRRSGIHWQHAATVAPAALRASDRFGTAIAVAGDRVVAGAPFHDTPLQDCGAAFVYLWTGAEWSLPATLTASDAGAGAQFGSALAASGEIIVIGAPEDDEAGTDAGALYVFRLIDATWQQEQKLVASDGNPFDRLGTSVAFDGDFIIAGAHYHDELGDESGAAYIFRFDGKTWSEETKLLASDGTEDDRFGFAVDIDGDSALIGAPSFWNDAPGTGAAYFFRRIDGLWTEERRLLASDGVADDWFGATVSINGTHLAVGARFDDNSGGTDIGSVYLYSTESGAESLLSPPEGNASAGFGYAIDLHDDLAMIGARDAAGAQDRFGAAYFYRGLDLTDCNANGITDICEATPEVFAAQSPELGPISADTPQQFVIESNLFAQSDVQLDFAAYADLNSHLEYINIWIDGVHVGAVFVDGASDCAVPPNTDTLVIPSDVYNTVAADGFVVVELLPTPGVAQVGCGGNSFVQVNVNFTGTTSRDTNANGVPDVCECPGDITAPYGEVNMSDLIQLLAQWGPCPGDCPPSCSADVNFDCTVGFNDLLIVLGTWGSCE